MKLLQSKEVELREVAKNLYWFDYLDAKEMEAIFKGKKLENKERVRDLKDEDKTHVVV